MLIQPRCSRRSVRRDFGLSRFPQLRNYCRPRYPVRSLWRPRCCESHFRQLSMQVCNSDALRSDSSAPMPTSALLVSVRVVLVLRESRARPEFPKNPWTDCSACILQKLGPYRWIVSNKVTLLGSYSDISTTQAHAAPSPTSTEAAMTDTADLVLPATRPSTAARSPLPSRPPLPVDARSSREPLRSRSRLKVSSKSPINGSNCAATNMPAVDRMT